MKTVGAYEAKTHLPRLLDEVAAGSEITITKHGVPVAVLVPATRPTPARVREAVDGLRAFRAQHRQAAGSIRELIEDGRRY